MSSPFALALPMTAPMPSAFAAPFLVFLGGGIGAALRYGFNLSAARLLGTGFPWGTFGVNVLGSLVMGLFAGWLAFSAAHAWSIHARLFCMTGILGGFTTFSAFSLDTVYLWERGELAAAVTYVLGSCVLSIAALGLGLAIVRQFS